MKTCVCVIYQQYNTSIPRSLSTSETVKYPSKERLSHISDNEQLLSPDIPYRQLVGSLVYLVEMTRPDICFAAHQLSMFTHTPGKKHWRAGKDVIKYLKGSSEVGLKYRAQKNPVLYGYCDSDFASQEFNRKCVTGYIFFYGNTPVSWKTVLQKRIVLSTCEAELEAMTEATKEAVYLRKLLKAFNEEQHEPTIIKCDNKSARKIAEEPRCTKRTKHLDVKFLYLQQCLKDNSIRYEYVKSTDNLSDMLTKPLTGSSFLSKVKAITSQVSTT